MVQSDNELDGLARKLGEALRGRRWHVASAESCTGGLLAKTLTDIPGSSSWFGWGFVTYADEAKTAMLGVPEALVATHGAVSEQVARAMAEGARRVSGAEVAVAVTGIAGPHGATSDKPVGTVWLAWAGPSGTRAEQEVFAGDREAVRRQSVAHALRGVQLELDRAQD
jgi:nicotinamide-nucleotide amidase